MANQIWKEKPRWRNLEVFTFIFAYLPWNASQDSAYRAVAIIVLRIVVCLDTNINTSMGTSDSLSPPPDFVLFPFAEHIMNEGISHLDRRWQYNTNCMRLSLSTYVWKYLIYSAERFVVVSLNSAFWNTKSKPLGLWKRKRILATCTGAYC